MHHHSISGLQVLFLQLPGVVNLRQHGNNLSLALGKKPLRTFQPSLAHRPPSLSPLAPPDQILGLLCANVHSQIPFIPRTNSAHDVLNHAGYMLYLFGKACNMLWVKTSYRFKRYLFLRYEKKEVRLKKKVRISKKCSSNFCPHHTATHTMWSSSRLFFWSCSAWSGGPVKNPLAFWKDLLKINRIMLALNML